MYETELNSAETGQNDIRRNSVWGLGGYFSW